MPTKVLNPVRRSGGAMYKFCSGCGQKYTPLGLSRHWAHCPKLKERKQT